MSLGIGSTAEERDAFIKRQKDRPEWSGMISIGSEYRLVKNGVFQMDGKDYAVSKDGRVVINKNLIAVGEIVGGRMVQLTASTLSELKNLGEAF